MSHTSPVISGKIYTGETSAEYAGEVELNEQGELILRCMEDSNAGEGVLELPIHFTFSKVKVSSRLGNTPRNLTFPNKFVFETEDNDGVDQLLKIHRPSIVINPIHFLEANFVVITVCIVAILMCLWLSVTQGIPAAAKVVANNLPAEAEQYLHQNLMAHVDRIWFEDSELDMETQTQLQNYFQPWIDAHPELNIKVHFRKDEYPNAFALPSGDIIFTDALVNLAENNDELLAIFGHEIGHLAERHGLRQVVQDGLLIWLLVTITGDISSSPDLIAGLPGVLVGLEYSREMEREADDYGLKLIREYNLDPKHFINIMERMHHQVDVMRNKDSEDQETSDSDNFLLKYFSTHPQTEERLEKFK